MRKYSGCFLGLLIVLVVCVVSGSCGPTKTRSKKIKQDVVSPPKKEALVPSSRQGWGWASSYSSGGYDIYTVIAVAAFAALLGALFFQLATGGTLRSLSTPILSFGMDNEMISELWGKVRDVVGDLDWEGIVKDATARADVHSRAMGDSSLSSGVTRWVRAYQRDPVDYQCIRQMACETLAESNLVSRSMGSNWADVVLSTVGAFIERGDQLKRTVKDIVGNPEKCKSFVPKGYCEGETQKRKGSRVEN